MNAYLIDTHLLVPRSRSSAKVKVRYQGPISKDRCFGGISVSQTHLVIQCTLAWIDPGHIVFALSVCHLHGIYSFCLQTFLVLTLNSIDTHFDTSTTDNF